MKVPPAKGFLRRSAIVYPWCSPIPLVFVEGNGSEMGTQFARATKNIIKRVLAFNLPIEERTLEKSGVNKIHYLKNLEAAVTEYTDPELLDELNSMADVVGVSYYDILLLNANSDVAASFPNGHTEDVSSCSAFAAWGKATDGSTTIVGHNDDGNRIMDQYSVLKVARPRHGFPFLCPQVPAYLGYDCLVNANQLMVCGTAIDCKMKTSEIVHKGVPNWALYRWLGQFASDATDATKRLLSAKSMTFKNWCLVSGGTKSVVIEATPKHRSFMDTDSKDWFGLATCLVCPEMKKYTQPSSGVTSGVYRKSSIDHELTARAGTVDPESAIEILSSHYDSARRRVIPSEHTPCRHMEFEGRFAGTCRTLIATFSQRRGKRTTRIDVCLGNPCNAYWRKIWFDEKFDIISGFDEKDEVEAELANVLVKM